MTKITSKPKATDMHLHIEKGRKIINDYLPLMYVKKVQAKFPDKQKPSAQIIRNVKAGLVERIDVLNALIEVAKEHKKELDTLKKLVTT